MDPALFFWIIIMVAICAIIWLFTSGSRAALIAVLCFAVIALSWAGFWSWSFRDGLGPGVVSSSGFEAWRRFGAEMVFPTSVCLFIGVIALGLFRWRR